MEIVNWIALQMGYGIIIFTALILIWAASLRCYHAITRRFYASRLWWEIHTIRVYYMKLEKMQDDPKALLMHRKIIERDCPKHLQEVWLYKIDQKLEEIRNEIKSHGEIPSF